MKKSLFVGAVFLLSVSISLTVGGERAAAQGAAGSGASAAAQDASNSSRSLNPIRWVKKDSSSSADAQGNRSDAEKKLAPSLQSQGLLPANVTVTDACAPFTELEGCLAALHASHNLVMNFYCLRANVTAVNTTVDLSGCKLDAQDKALPLNKAIHQQKPDANAKQATKDAEQQAKDDLKQIGD
jgi:hypothetical protein